MKAVQLKWELRRWAAAAVAALAVSCGGGGGRALAPEAPGLMLLAGDAGGPGNLDGVGEQARFPGLTSIASDSQGNLYVGQTDGGAVRRINPQGEVSLYAEAATHDPSQMLPAGFMPPYSIAVDRQGNVLTCDMMGIRRIAPDRSTTQTLACGGSYGGMTADAAGNIFYVNKGGSAVYKVSTQGVLTVHAGDPANRGWLDGPAAQAGFSGTTDIVADADGNLYVAEAGSESVGYLLRIRRISPDGNVSTFAGALGAEPAVVDGTGAGARFSRPREITIDGSGMLYVLDAGAVRKVSPQGVVSTMEMTGAAAPALGAEPFQPGFVRDFAADPQGNLYFIADGRVSVVKVDTSGRAEVFAGREPAGSDGLRAPARPAVDAGGELHFIGAGVGLVLHKLNGQGEMETLAGPGKDWGARDASGSPVSLRQITGMGIDRQGNVYLAEDSLDVWYGGLSRSGGGTIRKVSPQGVVSVLAGAAGEYGVIDGTGPDARFDRPRDLALDGVGNLYTGDGPSLRRISAVGAVTTVAHAPAMIHGLTVDAKDRVWFTAGGKLYRWAPGVATVEVASTGDGDLAVDGLGQVYMAAGTTVTRVTPDGAMTTIAGVAGEYGIRTGPLPGRLCAGSGLAYLERNVIAVTSCDAVLRLAVP